MKTRKPISTISYNTEKYLREKIYYWKKTGIIEYGMWILHQPDVDGDKAHFHVYLQPAKQIQTEFLVGDCREIDTTWKPLESYKDEKEKERHEKKQYLGMTVFKSSEPSNWILYGLHDEQYLMDKGLMRNVTYTPSDIDSTCEDTFMDMLSCAYDLRNNKLEYRIIDAVMNGMKWYQIVSSGMIPLNKISGALIMYRALTGQTDVDSEKKDKEE